MNLAALDYMWWGVSIGGHHYTGSIRHPNGTHELIRKLSRKDAKQLAEDDDARFWPKETNRYETLEDLEAAALKWCENNLGDVWLLLHHDTDNPTHVVGGKGYSKKRLARLEKYQKNWWSKTDAERERNWKQGYRIWKKLLNPDLTSARKTVE